MPPVMGSGGSGTRWALKRLTEPSPTENSEPTNTAAVLTMALGM